MFSSGYGYLKLEESSHFANELEDCRTLKDVFELVKDCVRKTLKESRAGIDIGLADMGNKPDGVLSAFYPMESNIIVVNTTPLRRIMETEPKLLKPYLFSVLLHEYLHSLGYVNEADTRKLSHTICSRILGDGHPATEIALDMRKFFPYILYPGGHPATERMEVVEVEDADYIG